MTTRAYTVTYRRGLQSGQCQVDAYDEADAITLTRVWLQQVELREGVVASSEAYTVRRVPQIPINRGVRHWWRR